MPYADMSTDVSAHLLALRAAIQDAAVLREEARVLRVRAAAAALPAHLLIRASGRHVAGVEPEPQKKAAPEGAALSR